MDKSRLLMGLLAAGVALSGCAGTPFGPPEQPRQFFAFGPDVAAFSSFGTSFNATSTSAFEGCFFADLNDEKDIGRIQIVGWMGLDSKINVDFGQPNGSLEQGGGVLFDGRGMPPTEHPIPFPDVASKVQTWGNATFELNDGDYDDPVSRNANWTAYFTYLADGVRRDDDMSVRSLGGGAFDTFAPRDVMTIRGDEEAHLVLRSNEGDLTNLNGSRLFRNPDETGSGHILSRNFHEEHFFENRALGAMGTFTIDVQSAAPTLAGTRLSFAFLSPGGRVVQNVTVGGGPLPTERRVVTIPLDEVLEYNLRVTGEATMATYRVALRRHAEEPLQYEFWWEDVHVGNDYLAWEECTRRLDAREWAAPLPNDTSLPSPAGIRVDVLLVAIGATLLVCLYVVKLVLDTVKGAEFRRKMRK